MSKIVQKRKYRIDAKHQSLCDNNHKLGQPFNSHLKQINYVSRWFENILHHKMIICIFIPLKLIKNETTTK